MSEQIENTQVENNNVKNDSTEAETNDNYKNVPDNRFNEVIAQKNKALEQANEYKVQLDKLKSDAETARQKELEKQGEYKTLLDEANVHSEELERSGRLKISSKNLKKFIGKTLNLKNRISENLYIFDSPDVTWEDEQLATLDYHLKQTFDLKNRYFAIEKRITIIKENLELFKGIWDHRESSTLLW